MPKNFHNFINNNSSYIIVFECKNSFFPESYTIQQGKKKRSVFKAFY